MGLSETQIYVIICYFLFQQELFHFDHKIMKHKHFKEEAEHSQRLVDEGHHQMKEKHETLLKKAEDHGKWVRTSILKSKWLGFISC